MIWDPSELNEQQRYSAIMRAIVPRPVILITTIAADGVPNAAPYSSCAPIGHNPPVFCFSSGLRQGSPKDTINNIRSTRCFVVNSVMENMLDEVLITAREFPPEIDEMKEAKLTALPSTRVSAPRIGESPFNMECRLLHEIAIGETHFLFIGEVLCFHVKEEILADDGRIDPHRFSPLGRISAEYYCSTGDHIIGKPTWGAGGATRNNGTKL